MNRVARRLFGVVAVFALLVAVCGVAVAQEAAPVEKQGPQDTVYQLAKLKGLNTFCKAVETAGLVDSLNALPGPITVLAPTDAAFAALGEEKLNALMADPEALKTVLNNHIIPGKRLMWLALAATSPLKTAAGTQLIGTQGEVDVDGVPTPTIQVQAVNIPKSARNFAANGMLYTIDAVLPQGAAVAAQEE
jgi:uncharacterized surface protein with fasciclin (FAS1) repeats